MGTIFKYNNQLFQCRNLTKKLKKMRLLETDIDIIEDNIPEDILEQEFVKLTRIEKLEIDDPNAWTYYVFQNSKGYYLWGINKPDITYIANFGFDIFDYKLIDTCVGYLKPEYLKWNPETGTGIK